MRLVDRVAAGGLVWIVIMITALDLTRRPVEWLFVISLSLALSHSFLDCVSNMFGGWLGLSFSIYVTLRRRTKRP